MRLELKTAHDCRIFKLPGDGDEVDEAARLFDSAARGICHAWLACRLPDAVPMGMSPTDWLTELGYLLIGHMVEIGHVAVLSERIRRFDPYWRGVPEVTVFQTGLRAIFAHSPDSLTRRDRERIGKRLWHAYRHYVPICFLRGFFLQLESPGLLQRAVDEAIEPGFEDWVTRQRAEKGDPSDLRGTYPRQIEKAIKKLNSGGGWD